MKYQIHWWLRPAILADKIYGHDEIDTSNLDSKVLLGLKFDPEDLKKIKETGRLDGRQPPDESLKLGRNPSFSGSG